jgi:hypothetical protein
MRDDAVEAQWAAITTSSGSGVSYADALAAIDSLGAAIEAAVEEGGYNNTNNNHTTTTTTTSFADACPQLCDLACGARAQCTDPIVSMAALESPLLEALFGSLLGVGLQSTRDVSSPDYFCKKFRNVLDSAVVLGVELPGFECGATFDSIVDDIEEGFRDLGDESCVACLRACVRE